MVSEATRKARKAHRQGKAGQEWVAKRLSELWPGVKSLWTAGRGQRQKDLGDDHTPYTGEVKKWGGAAPWPAGLESAFEQACFYAREHVDPSVPIVYVLNSPGPGHTQEARVYMDFEHWLEREALILKLQAEAGGEDAH